METTHEGRTYQVTKTQDGADLPHLAEHLKSRGWDGDVYLGISAPVGRQRTEYQRLFFRTKNGTFESVL